jgi:hypothetical protein
MLVWNHQPVLGALVAPLVSAPYINPDTVVPWNEVFQLLVVTPEGAKICVAVFVAVIVPDTVSPVRVPTEVILGWAAVVTVAEVPVTLPAIAAETVNPLSVPTLVMFGCAAVVTVPAVVALPAVATLRFATCVVDVTTKGAVPVAKVDVIWPDVVREVSVPTEVIFGCAAVVTVAADPVTLPAIAAVTVNVANVPTDVMFGCAAVVTVPATPAVATFKFATCVVEVTTNGAVPLAKVDVICPEVLKDVSVPTLVMFGCAAVVTVPAVVALPAVATLKFAT